jgi:hypothetical protein
MLNTTSACNRLATAIRDDIMDADDGQEAERLALIVAGREWGGWGREPLRDRLNTIITQWAHREALLLAEKLDK